MPFTLSDIPSVGRIEHIIPTLTIISQHENGITYKDLGRQLREIFSTHGSIREVADQKFGEEKGKFTSFFNLVTIEDSQYGNIFRLTQNGETYLNSNQSTRESLLKEAFLNNKVVVSILRQNMENVNFDFLNYLIANCPEASRTTLLRKVGTLKNLCSYMQSICSANELNTAFSRL